MGGLVDRKLGWKTITNLNNCSPLGETATLIVEVLSASCEAIKTSSGVFALSATEDNETFVQFDSSVNASLAEKFNEVFA